MRCTRSARRPTIATGCERPLCQECGERLSYCGACGAPVLRQGEEAPDRWIDTLFDKGLVSAAAGDPAAFVTVHALVPAAIVGHGLLLPVLPPPGALDLLRQHRRAAVVGFLFVFATVLTARYGATRADRATQAVYSIILLVATAMALMTRSPTTAAALSSMVLLAVVWLYATGVTFALSLEGKLETSTRGAVAPVVALALVALFVFAMGEPLMLNAEPAVAIQALVAIIVFLLSTGLTLAAASTTSQARRAYRLGGEVALNVMPLRIGAAAVVGVVVLAVGLVVPGVHYSGSGRIQSAPDDIWRSDLFRWGRMRRRGSSANSSSAGCRGGGSRGSKRSRGPRARRRRHCPSSRACSIWARLSCWRCSWDAWPSPSSTMGAAPGRLVQKIGDHLSAWWSRWARRLPRRAAGREPGPRADIDPFADLEGLAQRPAREAVVEAYLRSTVLLERLGHPRPPAATPNDLLGSLPEGLAHLAAPLQRITGLYVVAAYSDEQVRSEDREGAIATLRQMRDAVAAVVLILAVVLPAAASDRISPTTWSRRRRSATSVDCSSSSAKSSRCRSRRTFPISRCRLAEVAPDEDFVVDLIDDLVIGGGSEDAPEYQFRRLAGGRLAYAGIGVDGEGNIYVLQPREAEVRVSMKPAASCAVSVVPVKARATSMGPAACWCSGTGWRSSTDRPIR